MAGDWIKMRVGLVTHPRVIALSEELSYDGGYQDWSGLHGFVPAVGGSKEDFEEGVAQALRVTRYVTVTALLKFWGYANEHSRDDFIPNLRIADIDEITSVPGFGRALAAVGWAIYDEEKRGTQVPNFSEHNSVANDRTGAERQRRYREKKRAESGSNSDVTVTSQSNDREEKRREEINTSAKRGAGKTAIPENWQVGASSVEYCQREFGLVPEAIERYRVAFVDACKAKDYRYKDFDSAFRNCVRQDWPKFRAGGPAPVASKPWAGAK